MKTEVVRILIIKTSALGDIIHALPVLSYLQQAAPHAQIDWVVEEAFQELLSGNPMLHRLLNVAFKRWKKAPLAVSTLLEFWRVCKTLRAGHYDLVFDLQGNTKSGLLCWLATSKRKIGFSRENIQEGANAFFTTQQVPFAATDQHAVQRYLRIVSAPFVLLPDEHEWSADIHTSSEEDDYAASVIAGANQGPIILFHTGTTWQTKLWHEDGWLGLGRELLQRYPGAIILLSWGNAEEQERGRRLVEQLGSYARILDKLSLKQFAAVLKQCDLVVGGDTGPIHLAAAVGVPTLSFYRCTDGSRNGPYGTRHAIIQSPLPCTVCMRKSCERDQECRRSITVEVMAKAAAQILDQQKPPSAGGFA